jgi:hypothetical protein
MDADAPLNLLACVRHGTRKRPGKLRLNTQLYLEGKLSHIPQRQAVETCRGCGSNALHIINIANV